MHSSTVMHYASPCNLPAYDGLYLVNKRVDKFFTIENGGHYDTISLDQLILAYSDHADNNPPNPLLSPQALLPVQ